MKPDFDYSGFPASFAHCFNEKCLRGDNCLRRQMALRIPKERASVQVINPGYLESVTGEGCRFFLLDEPQQFAKGITYLFDDLPLRKANIIKSQIMRHMGRTNFYRCKRQERLVKPKEQAYIKKLFLNQGIQDEPKFDEYLDYYDLG